MYNQIIQIHGLLKSGKLSVDDLIQYKSIIHDAVFKILLEKDKKKALPKNHNDAEEYLRILITLCNDYYSLSSNGDVLITDREYDTLTLVYKELSGNPQIIMTDSLNLKTWEEKDHIAPNMIGSIAKVYTIDELEAFINKYGNRIIVFVMPKYDGCSVVLSYDVKDGNANLIAALTRKDGIKGQDVSPLIKRVLGDRTMLTDLSIDGRVDVKCEMLVSTESFEKLKTVKSYKNRRAAASAISANPSNIDLAQYLSIEPLVEYDRRYNPPKRFIRSGVVEKISLCNYNPGNTLESIMYIFEREILEGFKYRTDGIVFTIDDDHDCDRDIMANSVAFKFNTANAEATVLYGYVSVGRTGKVTPMIKVSPCEVNETEVTDVSLSNFKKANNFELHYNDTVLIESAGDVIPMVKDVVGRDLTKDRIKWDVKCPYCGIRFSTVKKESNYLDKEAEYELVCKNPTCPRVRAGKFANFLERLGTKDISDKIIMQLIDYVNLVEYADIFNIHFGDLKNREGWGSTSENKLLTELGRIRSTPTPYSKFVSALGIPLIAKKKCEKLFSEVSFIALMEMVKRNPETARLVVADVEGFSSVLATNVVSFLEDNYDEIKDVMSILNLVEDVKKTDSRGSVVFTGFRNEELKETIEAMGYEVSDNITKNTVAVVAATTSTGKAKKAVEKNIPLFMVYDYDSLLVFLR